MCVCMPTGTNEEKRVHQKDKDGKKQGENGDTPPPVPLPPFFPSLSPRGFIQSWVWQNLAQEPENGHVSKGYLLQLSHKEQVSHRKEDSAT